MIKSVLLCIADDLLTELQHLNEIEIDQIQLEISDMQAEGIDNRLKRRLYESIWKLLYLRKNEIL